MILSLIYRFEHPPELTIRSLKSRPTNRYYYFSKHLKARNLQVVVIYYGTVRSASKDSGKYCALFQCPKGPQDIGMVKRRSFSPQ
jgi:hypothetical protein